MGLQSGGAACTERFLGPSPAESQQVPFRHPMLADLSTFEYIFGCKWPVSRKYRSFLAWPASIMMVENPQRFNLCPWVWVLFQLHHVTSGKLLSWSELCFPHLQNEGHDTSLQEYCIQWPNICKLILIYKLIYKVSGTQFAAGKYVIGVAREKPRLNLWSQFFIT